MGLRAAIGDLHLSGFESDTLDLNNLPYRLGLIMKTLDFIISECRSRSINQIDILGDIINDKSIIYTVAQDEFKDFLSRNSDIEFRIISGNHDLSSTGALQKSAISVFDGLANVQCISDFPLVIDNITYVPYSSDFLSELATIEPNDILISHLGINEAHVQSGLSRIDKIRMGDLSKKFKLALLGHYHAPQYLHNGDIEIYYAGNICHLSWNDKNEKKRFLIYDPGTLKVESIPITGFREYREFIIENIDDKDDILRQLEVAENEGHVIRLKNKSGEKLTNSISENVMVIDIEDVDITNRGIEITQSRADQLQKYLEIKQIPENEHQEYLDVISKYDLVSTASEVS